MNQLIVTAVQVVGLLTTILGAFLIGVPVGITVIGLALLVTGWALDRE